MGTPTYPTWHVVSMNYVRY